MTPEERKNILKSEKALLKDSSLMEKFITDAENNLLQAPFSIKTAVMSQIMRTPERLKIPTLSRPMQAAACFCGAAAVVIFALTGLDNQILDFLSQSADKIGTLLTKT